MSKRIEELLPEEFIIEKDENYNGFYHCKAIIYEKEQDKFNYIFKIDEVGELISASSFHPIPHAESRQFFGIYGSIYPSKTLEDKFSSKIKELQSGKREINEKLSKKLGEKWFEENKGKLRYLIRHYNPNCWNCSHHLSINALILIDQE
jgi:hypothetical protein